jgi:hypothetical protein
VAPEPLRAREINFRARVDRSSFTEPHRGRRSPCENARLNPLFPSRSNTAFLIRDHAKSLRSLYWTGDRLRLTFQNSICVAKAITLVITLFRSYFAEEQCHTKHFLSSTDTSDTTMNLSHLYKPPKFPWKCSERLVLHAAGDPFLDQWRLSNLCNGKFHLRG